MLPACGACGLHAKCNSPKLKPLVGDCQRSVLIVGEGPSSTDDEMGKFLSGESGMVLRKMLRSIGINLGKDAAYVGATICHTKAPNSKHIDFCQPNLKQTIEKLQPRVVVTLGREALGSMLLGVWNKVDTVERWVGEKIQLEGHWLCPTYGIDALLRARTPLIANTMAEHLRAAFEISSEPRPIKNPQRQVRIIYDPKELAAALVAFTIQNYPIGFDYETNCLKPEYPQARIYSAAISNKSQTIAFPWPAKGTDEWLAVREIVHGGLPKIASNLKFEERWTAKEFGKGMSNWHWDTMLAAHCLDNRQGICSLKFQAFVKLGVPSYNDFVAPYLESDKGHYNRINEIDLKTLLEYNGVDAYLERILADWQREQLGYGPNERVCN